MARLVALALALLLTILYASRAITPPPALSASAAPGLFSAMRALPDVRTIATRPHPTGSVGNRQVRDYLVERLTALGLAPATRHYMIDEPALKLLHGWTGGSMTASEIVDVVGVLPGRNRSLPAVALMAHYDTVWGSPGGGDDTAGIASILEIVRAIKARGTPARDIVVLLTDGEELGLCGAKAFWEGDPMAEHVGAVVNLEARGAGGRATMFETGAGNGPMMRLFQSSVRHPLSNSLTVFAYRHMPNDTDFTPVREKGMQGFNFAILGRAEYYHSPKATADRLDPRSLQDMGSQVLDLVSALASAATLPVKGADATFFDPAGRPIIAYAESSGWRVVLGATAALLIAGFGLARGGRLRIAEIGHGAIGLGWLLSMGLLALSVCDLLSGSAAHPSYYDRLASLPELEAQAALAGLAALLGYMAVRRAPRRWFGALPALLLALFGVWLGGQGLWLLTIGVIGAGASVFLPAGGVTRWGGWLAGLILLLVLAVAAQHIAPGLAWLPGWPALVLAIGAALAAWIDPDFEQPWTPFLPAIAAAIVGAPLLALAHEVFVALGAQTAAPMLAAVLILGVAFWPLARVTGAAKPVLLCAGLSLIAAGVVAVQVRTDPMADTIPAYALDK